MKGLIIKEKWLNKIFEGVKIWEIRGCSTKIRDKIYLIQSGTKHILGECELIDCIKIDLEEYQLNTDKHKIETIKRMFFFTYPEFLYSISYSSSI